MLSSEHHRTKDSKIYICPGPLQDQGSQNSSTVSEELLRLCPELKYYGELTDAGEGRINLGEGVLCDHVTCPCAGG